MRPDSPVSRYAGRAPSQRLPLIAFMNNVQDIPCVAPEPVQSRNDQFVAGPKKLYEYFEFIAAIPTIGRHLL
jgi:hypothetical protein